MKGTTHVSIPIITYEHLKGKGTNYRVTIRPVFAGTAPFLCVVPPAPSVWPVVPFCSFVKAFVF